MKNISRFLVATLALFGVTSCNTAPVEELNLSTTTVTASFVDSRTTLSEGVKTLWSAEDKIEVNGVTFTLSAGAGEATATFTSTTPLAAAESYTASYPAGVTTIAKSQIAVAGSFDPQAALAQATGTTPNNLLFEHRHALLKFALAAPANKVEVLGYTLQGAMEPEKLYYVAVEAGTFEGLTAKVDDVEVRNTYNTVTLENGNILNLGTLPNAAVGAVGIRTAADLVDFAAEVAAQIAAEQTPDGGKFKDANGVVNILANIDMKDVAWTPISNFAGTLEGNNHTIDNLVVENATHAAMFKNLSGATVQNLVFGKGCSFTVTGTTSTYAGAVVAEVLTVATFKNIKTHATLYGGNFMGGIAGAAIKQKGTTLFENCQNMGSITYPAQAISADVNLGGICGYNEKVAEYKNCVNSGTIIDYANSGTNYNQIGGIVGKSTMGYMYNCSNSGSIKLDVRLSGHCYQGGLVGRFYNGHAEYCSNSGSVEVTKDTKANSLYVAGLFGAADGKSNEAAQFLNCSNTAAISLNCQNNTGNVLLAGICGYFRQDCYFVENCTNSGALSLIAKGNNSTVGGIIGLSAIQNRTVSTNNRDAQILNCKNIGSIIAGTPTTGGLWCHVGGIIGKSNDGLVSVVNCTNEGDVSVAHKVTGSCGGIISECWCDITNCTNHGAIVVENVHIGAGDDDASATEDLSATAGIVARLMSANTISNCKNYGVVIYKGKGFSVANTSKGIVGQGGICGLLNNGTVDNCENYGVVLSNDSETFNNAKGSIAGWAGKTAAVTIKNCKVGGALGSCVETDEDFGKAKATAVPAESYKDYIYGGDAGNGVTVTDCSFAVSE